MANVDARRVDARRTGNLVRLIVVPPGVRRS
jgi:hypothetical protein